MDSKKQSINEVRKIINKILKEENELRNLIKQIVTEEINQLSNLNYKEWNPDIPYGILKKLEKFGSSCLKPTDDRTCSSYYMLPDGFVVGGSSNYSMLPPVYGGLIKKSGRLFNRNNDDVTERYQKEAKNYTHLSNSLKSFFNLI